MTQLLPTIISAEHIENGIELTLKIDAKLRYFEGHFPQVSILPGVTQLDWAKHFASEYLSYPIVAIDRVEVLKYQIVIQPDAVVKLALVKKSEHKFTFKYHSESGTHASGRIVLRENVQSEE